MPCRGYLRGIVDDMQVSSPPRPVLERIEEAMREIGVLMLAFAPLDAAFAVESRDVVAVALTLTCVGIVLFALALLMERRRWHAA